MPGRESSQGRVSHTGRPSADVRVIIIIPPAPDGMVAPFSACQEAPLSGPRGRGGPLGPLAASGASVPSSAWASLQLTGSFFRCKDPSSCQQWAPQRGTSGLGGRGGGGGSAHPGNKGRLGAGRAPSGFNAQWPWGLAASLLASICIMSGAGTGARSIGNCEAVLSKEKGPVLKARLAYCNANSIQSRPALLRLPGAPAS